MLGVKTKGTGVELLARRSPQLRRLVVGVDGGGTATRAVILDDQQRVIAEGHAGPSNPLRVGIANAASAVRDAIDQACGEASIHRDDILAAAVGLAGVRRQDIRDRMRERLSECLKEINPTELFTDGEIALYGATGGAAGLVVIAGTGSICCGQNPQGKHVCAGGWGPIVGDEGGGSWIARKALQAVAQATDGRGPKTALASAALNYFKISTPDDLSTAIYAPNMTNDRLAGFSKQVMRVAQAGDNVAREILQKAGQQLGVAAVAVVRKLHMENEEFPVACVGGVYGAGDLVLLPMREEIRRVAKKARLAEPLYSPVVAAGLIARGLLSGNLALAV
ncbi:MAG TPA: BadF/BadG/BcrA/BcrD ATPase family protein [Pyrinomonadaceae bacterium]|nr:BadF/BadG/BcrA/BcrD ATPase family protein [Pyrinomonadaceae bacterium]